MGGVKVPKSVIYYLCTYLSILLFKGVERFAKFIIYIHVHTYPYCLFKKLFGKWRI